MKNVQRIYSPLYSLFFLSYYNRPTTEVQTSCSSVVLSGNAASAPVQLPHILTNRKPDHLPANLDEMKVTRCSLHTGFTEITV